MNKFLPDQGRHGFAVLSKRARKADVLDAIIGNPHQNAEQDKKDHLCMDTPMG